MWRRAESSFLITSCVQMKAHNRFTQPNWCYWRVSTENLMNQPCSLLLRWPLMDPTQQVAEKWSHCCVESSKVGEMANSQETSRQQVSNQTGQLASVNWDVCSHPSETREAERLANAIFYRSEMSTCASSNVRQQAHFWLNTLITTCKTPVVMMLGFWCHLNWAAFSL